MSIPYVILSDSESHSTLPTSVINLSSDTDATSGNIGAPIFMYYPTSSEDSSSPPPEPVADDGFLPADDPIEEDPSEDAPSETHPLSAGSTTGLVPTHDPYFPPPVPFFYQPGSGGVRTRATARKSVRYQQRNSAPLATTSTTAPTPIPSTVLTPTPADIPTIPAGTFLDDPPIVMIPTPTFTPTPTPAVAALRTWVAQEGAPSIFEYGESSIAPSEAIYLSDPVTPLLIARLVRQEREHQSLEYDFGVHISKNNNAIRGHMDSIREDAYLTDQSLNTMHFRLTAAQEETTLLYQRLERAEEHAAEMTRKFYLLEERFNAHILGASSSMPPPNI